MKLVTCCTQAVLTLTLISVFASGLAEADDSPAKSKSSASQAASPSFGQLTMLIQPSVAKAVELSEQQSETAMRLLRLHYMELEKLQFHYPRGAQDGEGNRARIHSIGATAKSTAAIQEQLRSLLSDEQTKHLATVAITKPSQMPRFEFKSTSERQHKKTRPQWGKPFGDLTDEKLELRWYGSQCRLVREEQDISWLWHPPEFLITNAVISPNGKYVLTVGNSLPQDESVDTHSLADIRIWEASSGMRIDVIQRRDEVDLVYLLADDIVSGHSYPWNGR